MKLTDYFNIYQDKFNDPGEASYHGSLVPHDEMVGEIEKIHFYIEYNNHLKHLPEIHHRNQTNSHIFKPRYYHSANGAVECSVPNQQVFIHTLRSLAFWFFHHSKKDIEIEMSTKNEMYIDYCENWEVNQRVIIGRTESVLNCFRYLVLIELGHPREIVEKIIIEQENSRLKNIPIPDNQYFKEADEMLETFRYPTENPRIALINCIYKDKPISIVQLPWGIDMTKDLVDTLFQKNQNIQKIGIVGGIGYIGPSAVSVDDVMIPETLVLGDDVAGYKVTNLSNNFKLSNHLLLSRQKRTCGGSLYTVVPEKGMPSNSYRVANNGGIIDGFDMELAGFVDELKAHPEVSASYVYYIMDIPEKGLGLGQTYYNFEFISALFSNVNRGKHYCIESTINNIIE